MLVVAYTSWNFYCYAECCDHRYLKSLNWLLKVCYVPATIAVLIAFFSSFMLRPLTVQMKQTRQLVRAVKKSIYLDVYGCDTQHFWRCSADYTFTWSNFWCLLYLNDSHLRSKKDVSFTTEEKACSYHNFQTFSTWDTCCWDMTCIKHLSMKKCLKLGICKNATFKLFHVVEIFYNILKFQIC